MRGVDASRADFHGASLAGVAVHGATLRRTNCDNARMAGMWSGWAGERPEVEADEDGTMPPMEPVGAAGEGAVGWAEQEAPPVDAARERDEDAQDETAWAAHKQETQDEEDDEDDDEEQSQVGNLVDMQHMDAT